MNGAVLSYVPSHSGDEGHGWVQDFATRRQYFYHTSLSPDLTEISHLGMHVKFEVAASRKTQGEEAVNLVRA
jgi:hypothetical protein